jgi:hypothetical protein
MNQIPKIIHYCWFGKNPLPGDVQKCIESWKKVLPDYELMLWNEDHFDLTSNQFVYEAYSNKKYAFVTDYVRLFALYNYGGIYMDTDVEVIKNLDVFLSHRAFTSFENESFIPTGLMASCKEHEWIGALLETYKDRKFVLDNGKLYNVPNTKTITDLTVSKYNLILDNSYQVLEGDIHIYPADFFCAKDWRTGKIHKTDNTYTIHHFMGSWVPKKDKVIGRIRYFIVKHIRSLFHI